MGSNAEESIYEEEYFDMTLACDDKQIEAHKIIISSSSPVLTMEKGKRL